MRAHQIMTRSVITVTPDTSIIDAANVMLQRHISGLPVVDASGKLVGVVSEGASSAEAKLAQGANAVAGFDLSSVREDRLPISFMSTAVSLGSDDKVAADHHGGYGAGRDRPNDGEEPCQAPACRARQPGRRNCFAGEPAASRCHARAPSSGAQPRMTTIFAIV